jgi:hypothetical protein
MGEGVEAMPRSKTHFEQIPVETVRRIANVDSENDSALNDKPAELDTPSQPPPAEASGNEEPWRELAKRVQREQDPAKMISLVEKLLNTLEGQRVSTRK